MQKEQLESWHTHPVSEGELKRRYGAVQAALKNEEVDCLILQTHSNIFDSNIRYFLDIHTGSYGTTLMIPADGGMIYLSHGENDDNAPVPPWAGNVEKAIVNHFCPPFPFTNYCAAELVEKEIRERGFKKVGLAYLQLMGYSFGDHLTRTLADVEFVDFSYQLHEITAVKSEEEWKLIDLSMRAHEKLMEMLPALIVPGRAEYEILADLKRQAYMIGCEVCGSVFVNASRPGKPGAMSPKAMGSRRIEPGDNVNVLIEVSGPGGMYGELSRIFSMSDSADNITDLFEISKEIQHTVAAAAKPGVTGAELNSVYNECAAMHGFGPNLRYSGHGQGYDMMESPAISKDENMALKEDMLFAIHPGLFRNGELAVCCDNFRITADGAELIIRTPQKVFHI